MSDDRPAPIILGIDPGTFKSAWVLLDSATENNNARFPWPVLNCGTADNEWLLSLITQFITRGDGVSMLAVEMVASFGMPVGAEVFDTVLWIGRYIQQAIIHGLIDSQIKKVTRHQSKYHHCHATARVTDANVRQALIDRFGGRVRAIGTKKNPGPLYEIHNDEWQALAVAMKVADDWHQPF